MTLPKGIKWPVWPHPNDHINIKNKHKLEKISKFSNFKIKWPKAAEKLENGGRLGSLGQNLPPPPPKKDPLDPQVQVAASENNHYK